MPSTRSRPLCPVQSFQHSLAANPAFSRFPSICAYSKRCPLITFPQGRFFSRYQRYQRSVFSGRSSRPESFRGKCSRSSITDVWRLVCFLSERHRNRVEELLLAVMLVHLEKLHLE